MRSKGSLSEPKQERHMVDKDRVAGSANQAAGKVKEWAGKVTGDSKTEAEGKADQVKGKISERRRRAQRRRAREIIAGIDSSFSGVAHRQRRCSHSHCSGFWRIQPSITVVIACIVPLISTRPVASRTGSTGSETSPQKLLRSGLRTTRMP